MKEIIDEVEKTGLSISKIISIGSTPCEKCKGLNVTYYPDKGGEIVIKRSILATHSVQDNGQNILTNKSYKENDCR